MAVEDLAGLVPYFSRKAVTIQRQSGDSKPGPAALHKHLVIESTRAEKHRQNSDASQALQTKNPQPRCTCVGRTGARPGWCWSYAEQDLAGSLLPHSALTFLLMCSRRCSWPCRKQRCWNSVSSLSGLTSPPCSMFTTFLKPSAQRAHSWWAAGPSTPCTSHPHHSEDISDHPPHFLSASAYPWTCFWVITTRNPGQGRALCIPLATPAAACAMKAFPSRARFSQELKFQLLESSCLSLQATGIQGKVFQRHRPSTGATYGKKGHVHIWKSALSTSLKSLKVSKLYLRTGLKFTKMLL